MFGNSREMYGCTKMQIKKVQSCSLSKRSTNRATIFLNGSIEIIVTNK